MTLNFQIQRLLVSFFVVVVFLFTLLFTLAQSSKASTNSEILVCPSGCPYNSIQAAVDAANDGDVIKVATGHYTGTNLRGGLKQVVYLSKTLSLRGGYTSAFTEPPDPDGNPTEVDALSQGRVLYISGDISATIEGLYLMNGSALGQGGYVSRWGYLHDAGSNVYVLSATFTFNHNRVIGNRSAPTGDDGGIFLLSSQGTFQSNILSSTYVSFEGGGMYAVNSAIELTGNTILGNAATSGGGLSLYGSSAQLTKNVVNSNYAAFDGGGVTVEASTLTMLNTVIVSNSAEGRGNGLWGLNGSSIYLSHNTIANNVGGLGVGVSIDSNSTAQLTNTILVSQAVGITVDGGGYAKLSGVLWYGNGLNSSGAGVFVIESAVIADPAFASDGFHLTSNSAAINKGIMSGVAEDIDGDNRPDWCFYDLGADEFITGKGCIRTYLPHVLKGGS